MPGLSLASPEIGCVKIQIDIPVEHSELSNCVRGKFDFINIYFNICLPCIKNENTFNRSIVKILF